MLHVQSVTNIKFITALLLVLLLVGCGGGRATTTSSSADVGSNPEPELNPLGSATLSWLPPTAYTDDSVIIDLGGHHIYIDDGKGFTKLVTINNPSISVYIIDNLSPGTYSLVVTAFDSDGIESTFSKATSITIT